MPGKIKKNTKYKIQNIDSLLIFQKVDNYNCPFFTFIKILFQRKNEKMTCDDNAVNSIF